MANKNETRTGASAPIVPVSYAGDSIQKKLFRIGLALVIIGFVFQFWNQHHNQKSNAGAPDIMLCDGLKKPVLSSESTLVRQTVRNNCFSAVLVSPSSLKAKIAWQAPGAIEVCFWKYNQCVAWMRIKNGQMQEQGRDKIPNDYTAILLRGDPGEAEVRLLR